MRGYSLADCTDGGLLSQLLKPLAMAALLLVAGVAFVAEGLRENNARGHIYGVVGLCFLLWMVGALCAFAWRQRRGSNGR
jgi:Kef-type K+ transport system membrane component KefB